MVVIDEAWELAGLALAHADLIVPPLACPRVLSEGHQTPANEDKLRGHAWHPANQCIHSLIYDPCNGDHTSLQGPVQNEHAGPLVPKVLRISTVTAKH